MISIREVGTKEILQALSKVVPELQDEALRAGAQAAFNTAQDSADEHTVTGAMARSVRMRPLDGGYIIDHDLQQAPHTLFVHWGTKPHIIKPDEKKALRWPSGTGGGTKFVFAKRVHHPGYRGDPWMIRARDDAAKAILRIAQSTRP